jgi:hypothetical protein
MDVLHPGFAANITARVNEDLSTRAELEPRQPTSGPPFCIPVAGQGWARASLPEVNNALSWLRTLDAEGMTLSSAYPGPRACTQISCSYSAAI